MADRQQDDRKPGVIYISPSQVTTYKDCPRKWAYRYIDKIKSPPKPEQQFGIEGHERNEKYLGPEREWVGEDDVGKTCQQGIKKGHLPTPADDLLIEQKLEIPIFNGKAMMIGYVDCIKPPRPKSKGEDLLPIVHDWKFTKDLRWAMKTEDLDDDAQVAVYAKAAFIVYEKAKKVMARWVYFCGRPNKKAEDGRPRTPRGVRPVEKTYTRDRIDEMWGEVMKVARKIIHAKQTFKEAKEVEANELHCDAYGGCAHREYCPVSGSVGIGARLEQYDKTHSNKALTQSDNANNDAASSDGGKDMSADDLLAQLRSRGESNESKADKSAEETKASPPPTTEATPPAAEGSEDGVDFLARMQGQMGAGEAVNPPETPAGGAEADGGSNEPSADEPNSNDLLASLMGKGGGEANKSKTETKPAEPPAETAATETKPTEPPATTAEPATEPTKVAKKKRTAKRKGGFIMAVDVAQVKGSGALGDVVHLSEFLQPITDWIAKEYKKDRNGNEWPEGVGHWGLIPFGEGKALLAKQVEAYLDKHGFKGVLMVDSSTPEASAVMDALLRRADVVMRGVR